MHITVNGEARRLDSETTLSTLLENLDLKAKLIAIELNGRVIARAEWPTTRLTEADRIEIVHFVGGG